MASGELLLICWSVERNSLVFFSVFLTSVVQSQSHIQFFASPWAAALKLTVQEVVRFGAATRLDGIQ